MGRATHLCSRAGGAPSRTGQPPHCWTRRSWCRCAGSDHEPAAAAPPTRTDPRIRAHQVTEDSGCRTRPSLDLTPRARALPRAGRRQAALWRAAVRLGSRHRGRWCPPWTPAGCCWGWSTPTRSRPGKAEVGGSHVGRRNVTELRLMRCWPGCRRAVRDRRPRPTHPPCRGSPMNTNREFVAANGARTTAAVAAKRPAGDPRGCSVGVPWRGCATTASRTPSRDGFGGLLSCAAGDHRRRIRARFPLLPQDISHVAADLWVAAASGGEPA